MKRRRHMGVARGLDQITAAQAFAHPGIDSRTWISYGIVYADDPEDVVVFDEAAGQPFVRVILEPSKVPVYCRVASSVAGNGEGEWSPFIQKDEVLVAIPQGFEDAGPVIIGRLNNSFDRFPMQSVAGQDPTTNTFGFRRRRTPFVEEYAGPLLLRTALSEAFISIDEVGTFTVRDGQGSAFQISPDVIGLQDSSAEFLLQMNLTDRVFIMQAGDAYFQIAAGDSGNPNALLLPDPLSIATVGNSPIEHAATTEGIANLIANIANLFAIVLNATPGVPLTTTNFAAYLVHPVFSTTVIAPAIAAAILPLTGTLDPVVMSALSAAFLVQPQKLPSVTGQSNPGIGCQGLNIG